MNDIDVGRYWDENADNWTLLARAGCDVWRDLVNAPAFQRMLPDVNGLSGLDVGCGEGYNTRLTAARGARMLAFDISPKFVRYADEEARRTGANIRHLRASALHLPFPGACFDFAMATMSLMDTPDHTAVINETYRVLRPGGFLQFSVLHPLFNGADSGWEKSSDGLKSGFIVRDYFNPMQGVVEDWIFSHTPPEYQNFPKFHVPRFDRTFSGWLNLVAEAGFILECCDEPTATGEARERFSKYADSGLIPFSLIIRCRRPSQLSDL